MTKYMRVRIAAALIIAIVALCALVFNATSVERYAGMVRCDMFSTAQSKIDCWDSFVRAEFKRNGIGAAFGIFDELYKKYPDFVYAAGGCHQRAHLIGDAAYFDLYVGRGESLDTLGMTGDVVDCGGGFLHGFLEHLFNARTDPRFASATCATLQRVLAASSEEVDESAVSAACFHGVGHGLMLAEADTHVVPDIRRMDDFLARPYARCDAIPGITETGKYFCKKGVLDAFFYIFSFTVFTGDQNKNVETLFDTCASLRPAFARTCYGPIGSQLAYPTNGDVYELSRLIRDHVSNEEWQGLAFEAAVASAVSVRMESNPDAGQDYLAACREVPRNFWEPCILGISQGIGINATYADSRARKTAFCASKGIEDQGLRDACMRAF